MEWFVGPLSADEDDADRLGPSPVPGNVSVLRDGDCLLEALASGRVDAIFTPYMPPSFHSDDSPVRHLLVDYPAEESAYYRQTGYVPGVHLVTLKRKVVDEHPWLPAALTDFLGKSRDMWLQQRQLLADTTPWELKEVDAELRTLGRDWMPFGVEKGSVNKAMTETFCLELFAQGVSA